MKTSKRLLSILLMLTMLLSMFTVMASAAAAPCDGLHGEADVEAGTAKEYPKRDATCKEGATPEYWECLKCGEYFWFDGNGKCTTSPTAPAATGKPDATKHQLRQVEAKDATCKEQGNIPYVICDVCGNMWRDMTLKDQITVVNTPIDTSKHKYVPVAEKEETCTEDGNAAYSKCSVCGQVIDAEGKKTDLLAVTYPKLGHKIVPARGNPATCTDKGVKDHYECARCGAEFADAYGKTPFTDKEIPAAGHQLTETKAVEPTCTENGTKAYWTCSVCKKMFSDKKGTQEIERPETISALGHDLEHVAAKEPTKTATGNIEYWHCKRCDKYFSDKDGTTEIQKEDTVIPQLKEEKHVLTINVPKVDNKVAGTVTYEGAELPKLEGLQNGDTRTLVAEAKDGYEFLKWEVTGATVSSDTNTTTTVKMGDTDATITAKFVKKTAPVDTFKLTVEQVGDHGTFKIRKKLDNGKWGDWWTAADDGYTSTEISNLKKGTSYQIKAVPGTNYEASWKVNNKTATVDNDIYTATINKNDISVEITFTKIDTKNLKLSVDLDERHGKLKYYDDDEEKWVTYDDEYWTLSKGDKVEFKAVPDSGYKAVWQLGSGSKTSATYYDVTYRDMDGKNRTLHVDFVKKSSSDVDDYPTLTFDITGGKHGTVYRGTREYEDGDVISIKKNDKMTFKAKTDKGYVAVWTYKGDTYVGDEYTVKMGANDAKLYVEFMDKDDIRLTELPFRDVSKRDWYYDDVVYVYRKGYMDGMSSTRFGGELNTTRGQIVTILWRLTGEPRATKRNPFTDVSSSQYYYDAISWAYDAGVVDGFDAHTFKPDQNVTREQLAAILYRYAKYMNLSTGGSAYLAKYRDADKIANWAYDAMAWANYRGLINGTSATRIDPKGYATRAQIAAILHRFAVEYGA